MQSGIMRVMEVDVGAYTTFTEAVTWEVTGASRTSMASAMVAL